MSRTTKRAAWLGLVVLLIQMLAACGPSLTPQALPAPAALVVQRSPALQPIAEQMGDCIEELNNTGLIVMNSPAGLFDPDQAALGLRWASPPAPQGYAAVIGQEELVIIMHPQNAPAAISLADLRAIYQGRLRAWPWSGGEVQAWAYPGEEDIQQVFQSVILDGQPLPANTTYTAPDPAAMLEAIAESQNAVGFVPRRWMNDTVQAVTVADLDAARLRQPIIAMSKSEPKGLEKAWLLCLQERLKE